MQKVSNLTRGVRLSYGAPNKESMSIKEALESWKSIVAFVIIIVGATVGLLAWAEDQVAVVEAKQQLLHDRSYQNSRIVRKEDQIVEAEREIETIEEDEPTARKEKKVDKLDAEVDRLEKEIEEIRVLLQKSE
jgi:hypothetical protein